uniref:Uncharacterized protein n=1 Tax=Glossina austeni TaxID=7395 RepID=A0A1A9UI32_GLOAU
MAYNPDQPESSATKNASNDNTKPVVGTPQPAYSDYYKSNDHSKEVRPNPLERSTESGPQAPITWHVIYSIHFLCQKTMPDCRIEKYRNWYPFTFMISMISISFYSYFMVWMITVIGSTLAIPPSAFLLFSATVLHTQ